MKAVIYSRVSTNEQSADNQIPALEQSAESCGWQIVEVYSENESAWRNGHQKELAKLILDARQRKFEVVLVWALDRLSSFDEDNPIKTHLLCSSLECKACLMH